MEQQRSALGHELAGFSREIFLYLFMRFRQIIVVLSVAGEVTISSLDSIKRGLMRYVFWGRGSWYRLVVVATILISVGVLPFTLQHKQLSSQVLAEAEPVQAVSETDLLVERGSSQTLVPKGRSRLDIITYTVQGGDTISVIAERHGVSSQTLLWANDMSAYDFIRPGDQLKIPPGNGVIHTVSSGDTLSSVAGKYNAAEQAIADVNWLDPPFNLVEGQTLFIPEGTMPPPPAPPTPIASVGSNAGSVNYPTPSLPPADPSASRFLGWPVSGGLGLVTQCPSAWHMAIDIANSSYPPLIASAAGTVIFAGMSDPWGYAWSVQIDHGNGYTTWYAHMSSIAVVSGQYVAKGQVIGNMGATGLATGVHVHFELRAGVGWASRINPAPYMDIHVCGY
ncbi:MAG: M23 family metallopeptidase [Candidatus Dojkabacteria bacterium]|nr:M23 family metallopeptidase [Candidatus Dojkabacteria bacterium]